MAEFRFKILSGCSKPRKEQALIYYTCLNYDKQPKHIREKIDRLCEQAGGEYAAALKDALLHADVIGMEGIGMKYFCSPNTIWTARRKFFELW